MTLYPEWDRPDDQDHPLELFAMEMLKQLKLHENEKSPKFQDLSVEQLIQLAGKEFQKRFQNASELSDAELERQCVHMGNYIYFVWSQIRFRQDTS